MNAGTRRKTGVAAALATAVAVLAVVMTAPQAPPALGASPGSSRGDPTVPPRASGIPDQTPIHDLARIVVVPSPKAVSGPTFDELVEALVAEGVKAWRAADAEDEESFARAEVEGKRLLDELQRAIPDSDERALQAMHGLVVEDVTIPGRVRRSVLLGLIQAGLATRWQTFEFGGSRAASDALVSAILASVPADETVAEELGSGLLADQPYLGPAHENAVLGIVESAAEEPFLAEVATALLRTLWHNLEASGARNSARLSSLAMLFLEDDNPSRRRAAVAHLLTVDGGRFVELVLQHVRRTRDRELASFVGETASIECDPQRAVQIVAELSGVIGKMTHLTGPFLTLAHRDPSVLRASYEQRLADGVTPDVRGAIVAGIGFRNSDSSVAELAFDHDPSVDVREQALFVLAAHASPEVAERCFGAALDDPAFAVERRLCAIIGALDNLGAAGEVNVVDRIGRRIREHPALGAFGERELARLLARYTPHGGG